MCFEWAVGVVVGRLGEWERGGEGTLVVGGSVKAMEGDELHILCYLVEK